MAEQFIDRSSFRRNNNLEQRKLMHARYRQRDCKDAGKDPEKYAFIVIEPTPALLKAKKEER
ncbi:MAG: hypothetical protein JST59_00520 [Actinobacteria bacterium]|nr:hypothetical protein [Actinomycetota bacterium]